MQNEKLIREAGLKARDDVLERIAGDGSVDNDLADYLTRIVDACVSAALTPSVADPAEAVQPVGGAVVRAADDAIVSAVHIAYDERGKTHEELLPHKEVRKRVKLAIEAALSLPQAAGETETAGPTPAPQADVTGSELKRFRLAWSNPDGGTATLSEHPDGEFVTYDDAMALLNDRTNR